MNNILLLDIDRTLLDNDNWGERRVVYIAEYTKVDEQYVQRISDSYKASLKSMEYFDVDELDSIFSKKTGVDKGVFRELYLDKGVIAQSSFEDLEEAIGRLKSRYTLGVFSAAKSRSFQIHKLDAMGVLQFVDKDLIFISTDKTNKEFLDKLPPATIVDDNPSVVRDIVERSTHLTPIWLNRRNLVEEMPSSVRVISNLLEIP